jgi:hypothetical protein
MHCCRKFLGSQTNDKRRVKPVRDFFMSSVSQTVVRACLQAVSEENSLQKLSDTERIKNTPINVCAKTAFVS